MGLVTLGDFEEVLREAASGEVAYALVGGLAVALWAERFAVGVAHLPLYSKDLDLRGARAVAQSFGLLLKARGFPLASMTTVHRKIPPGMGKTHVLQVELPAAGRTNVEVLERLPLLDAPDGFPAGRVMRVAGIQVLDPISLLICKAHAWNHRLQNEASNDAVHIEMLVEIVPQFIAEAKARKLDVSPQIAALRTAVRSCPLPLEMAFWESISLSAQ